MSQENKLSLIIKVLDFKGLKAALQEFEFLKDKNREVFLFCIWCAKQSQHLIEDAQILKALDVAERFANGMATEEELKTTINILYGWIQESRRIPAEESKKDAIKAVWAACYGRASWVAVWVAQAIFEDVYKNGPVSDRAIAINNAYANMEKHLREVCES